MVAKINSPITVTALLKGAWGDEENLPEEDVPTGEGDVGGGAGTGDAPTGGAGEGALVDSLGGFVTCAGKIGMSEDEMVAIDNEFGSPFGNSPDGQARQRTFEAGLSDESDPDVVGTNGEGALPASCSGIANDAPESLKISKYFTVAHFCSRAENYKYRCKAQNGLSRAQVICNLRHLALNIMDPILDYFKPLGYSIVISSGFRHGSGGSDHYKGSAVDLIILYKGKRLQGRNLTRFQKALDQVLKLPYTQMINEADRLLHIACRRTGGNSRTRMYWSRTYGPFSGPGYRYKVSLDGSPPVR